MRDSTKLALPVNFEPFEVRAGIQYPALISSGFLVVWPFAFSILALLFPQLSSWLPPDFRIVWLMLVLPAVAALVQFFVIWLRTRAFVLTVDGKGMTIRNGDHQVWHSYWPELQFEKRGLLLRVYQPVDSSGNQPPLHLFDHERARMSALRSKIRALQPHRSNNASMTLGRAVAWTVGGLAGIGAGFWIGEFSRNAKQTIELKAETEIRPIGTELTLPVIGLCVAALLMIASIMPAMMLLIYWADVSMKKHSLKLAKEDGDDSIEEFIASRGDMLAPVELNPELTYRYANPSYLKSSSPSAKWPVAMIVALCLGIAVFAQFVSKSTDGAWILSLSLVLLSAVLVAAIWPQERRLSLLRDGLNDRFRIDTHGRLVVLRDGQSYPVEAVLPKRPRRWEAADSRWGIWWEEYRAADKVFVVDRRFFIVDGPR